MSYYRLLGLEREPFSSSPDPEFFYHSLGHQAALFRLGTAIRLKRGLSVVLGDAGTGKTTLCRCLYQLLGRTPEFVFHVILNPSFESEQEFLQHLLECFHASPPPGGSSSPARCLQAIETDLFQKASVKGQTVVLLIDEAQKLNDPALEILRILLNYETNDSKLLQLVLFSQMELLPRLQGRRNLWDRINLKQHLQPLDEGQTREMILFRLKAAGYRGARNLFTSEAIREIHRFTQGYPRRIAVMAHDALERLVMFDRERVEQDVILDLIQKERSLIPAGFQEAVG